MVYANEWNPIPGQHQSPPDVPYGLDLPCNVSNAIKLLVSEGFLDDGCAVFDYIECMHDRIEGLEVIVWHYEVIALSPHINKLCNTFGWYEYYDMIEIAKDAVGWKW